jgi:hypothetical protein
MESFLFSQEIQIFFILLIFRLQKSKSQVSSLEVSNTPILPTDQRISIFATKRGAKNKTRFLEVFSKNTNDVFLE